MDPSEKKCLKLAAMVASFTVIISLFQPVTCASKKASKVEDIGSLNCTKGNWVPDPKLIGFGLSCPLPLDGTSKSKGKTANCAMKKLGVYDDKAKTMKKNEIGPKLCSVFKQDNLLKQCKQQVTGCLKDDKGYFKDPKEDKEYKSWAPPYECIEKWVKKACKKS